MHRRTFLSATAACVGLGMSRPARAEPAAAPRVVLERAKRLRLGVNLSHWLWLPKRGESFTQRDGIISLDELKRLSAAGATHVRLPIEPADYWHGDHTGSFLKDGYDAIRSEIDKVLDAGLTVIVDCHPQKTDWMKVSDDGHAKLLEAFWTRFAEETGTHVPALDPERVFLEILNEPHDLKDPKLWNAAQSHLAKLLRERFPKHTILATGDEWGGIDGLLRLRPLDDDNVIYSFHFYDPHNFTHQGATWGYEPWRHMKSVPWPMTKENVEPIASAIEDKQARDALRWGAKEPWDAERVRTRIKQAADWAREHDVPVYCGEFGVYAQFSPRESRLAWLRDVTKALDEFTLGRAMWDYAGGFALTQGEPGQRTLDAEVCKAIGMRG